jgi:type II secretory pathway component PulM
VLALYVVYMLAWRPLAQGNDMLARQNAAAALSLENTTRLAAEYRVLQQRAAQGGQQSQSSLTEVVDRSVKAHQLQMSRFQPGSSGDVQVRLDNAVFDHVLRWLHQLESGEGVSVRELSLSRGADAGLVNVSVRLHRL